ncbi:MAG: HPr(Ser) kinase/phosphatase [Candidatus Latescibacterota bacterium]|jgi:HPr kinase/phosphorylase|tara:strand:+ start:329 stop:1261 length:933 start_codon:yes stop_codon:yes gene_type:complete
MTELSIRKLLKTYGRLLGLKVVAGQEGLDRVINSSDTYRPGMALTGFVELFTVDQLQILGNTEMEYLRSLSPAQRREALEIIYQFDVPGVLLTGRGRMIPELRQLAEECGVPLLKSEFETTKFNHLFHFYLDDVFAPQITLHGTLVDVHGIGLLFKGRSAIGKSEVGLDLVERGHRLVADDAVIITRKSQGILVGTSSDLLRNHMEIRGIGIMDVKKMFGVRGTRLQKRVEVVVQLVDWDDKMAYERVGDEDKAVVVLGVEIPEVTIPLFPGKNITVIVEAIAMEYLLRIEGHHAARELNQRLLDSMNKK